MDSLIISNKSDLVAIADAIRAKTGQNGSMTLEQMPTEIEEIEVGNGSAVIESLTVTENGTYTPPEGVDGYSPVTVNVTGGSSGSSPAVLVVKKYTGDTANGENTFYNEQFIVLDIYPKTNGTVSVTYGDLTKTITDTSGATVPEPQSVFFGTLYGVTDDVETPESGILIIEGEYRGFGVGTVTDTKPTTVWPACIVRVDSFGDAEFIPYNGFSSCDVGITITVPTSVRFIDAMGFFNTYRDSPRTIIMLSTLPPCLGGNDVFDYSGGSTIIVPSGCGDIYKNAPGWSEYADYITEAEEV